MFCLYEAVMCNLIFRFSFLYISFSSLTFINYYFFFLPVHIIALIITFLVRVNELLNFILSTLDSNYAVLKLSTVKRSLNVCVKH